LRERASGGCDGHIGGRHIRSGDVPFPDSGAVQNPLIIGLYQLFEVLIGEESGGRVAP
jgi:hypothetical protein